MTNIHGTSIAYRGAGILIIGKSGSGKSDLALRMIISQGAILVADDRTNLVVQNQSLLASCPDTILGLLEVRGVGLKKMPFLSETTIKLVVELVENSKQIERLPEPEFYPYDGLQLPLLKLWPFEASATEKLVIKMDSLLD